MKHHRQSINTASDLHFSQDLVERVCELPGMILVEDQRRVNQVAEVDGTGYTVVRDKRVQSFDVVVNDLSTLHQ